MKDGVSEPGASPYDVAAAREELEHRLGLVRELLPFRHYVVYVLRRVRCLDAKQTGAALGVSAAAVNSIMHRVNQKLRGFDEKQ